MFDGVVDIPLPGRTIVHAAGQDSSAPSSHFFVGPENRLVEVAVRAVLDESPNTYSPLVLYGPSGTGKSHIAHGMAAEWKSRRRHARVVCTTAVDFARELADAIEAQGVEEFRAKYRKASLLVFEDLGMLATRKSGKLSAQEELVHTIDAVIADGGWVVVTAAATPSELPGILPALHSRLAAGLTIPLAPPGVEARAAILQQLAELRSIALPASLLHAFAEGISGTAPELAGALTQLELPIRIDGGEIDAPAVEAFLTGRQSVARLTLHAIGLATARHFALKLSALRSSARQRNLVTARGVMIYLARTLLDESFERIGRYLGGRDHTTAMHSYRKMETLLETDPAAREAVRQLHSELGKK